ncbi:MAG: O-antigen ligase C-terminal domain-containing protein [Burkholderiaceae bacterium]|nr:O-antigen ligase C-terminal domain-containing protein [Burkholderiaceae bacterium]
MRFAPISAMLTVLATAFPFLFPYTAPPSTNFWPLMMAWLCGWGIFAVGGIRSQCARGKTAAPSTAPDVRVELVPLLAVGLLLAALLASAIGLLQYFDAAAGWEPWIHASRPGQAMGNLRQRNQQATLLSMGVWALLWTVAQTQLYVQAQAEGRAAPGVGMALHGGGRPWPLWLVGMLTAWALALLAVGSAATASRTGLAQWLVVVVLLWAWRVSVGRLALGLALAGLAMYAAAAWLLPDLLLQWTGFRAEGLFARFGDAPGCTSRRVLWSNVLYLIAQKPWLGWGWGELDFAHYSTLFPGERFCVLLDNAHNLPLHLAVELGLPVAVLACAAVAAWIWRARPWRETDPARQLAWGILALVGLHSMLEFPLWYGPFQLVTVLALLVLWRSPVPGSRLFGVWDLWQKRPPRLYLKALAAIVFVVALVGVGWDYYRVSQVFKPVEQRLPSLRQGTLDKVSDTWLFSDAVDFARLTTMPVNQDTAERVHGLAIALLHYSPEPRVIEPLIESAALLGRDDEVAYHLQRFRVAYPKDFARWSKANKALGLSRSGASGP